jgi:hypothetical protein
MEKNRYFHRLRIEKVYEMATSSNPTPLFGQMILVGITTRGKYH